MRVEDVTRVVFRGFRQGKEYKRDACKIVHKKETKEEVSVRLTVYCLKCTPLLCLCMPTWKNKRKQEKNH